MARNKQTDLLLRRLAGHIRCAQCVSAIVSLATSFSYADEQFNTSFIHGEDNVSRVMELANGDDILPGRYPFDIYVNKKRVDHREIEFKKLQPGTPGTFCLSVDDYREYGILVADTVGSSSCYDIEKTTLGSSMSWDVALQELDISVPQAHMEPRPQGMISSRMYDNGISAAYINYSFSGDHNRFSDGNGTSRGDYSFLSLNNGVNLGSLRLRNNSTLSKQPGETEQWTPISSWMETDIVPLRSRVLMGQSSTNNDVFDSFQFRGMQISSIPEMLPDSLRGYAPVVRGVANTNARVEVRQNGYTVYSTVVSPGPFVLNDIYPSNLSGDLDVTVIEADGSRHSFSLPYSSVPNMLREGMWEYQITAGKYHDGSTSYKPRFVQAIVSHGTHYDLTPYGGLLLAEDYRSGVFGIGSNLGKWGAASVDAAWSDTNLASGENKRGTSFRFLYSKSLNSLGTEFQLAGYRYSTSGYYDFSDAINERASWDNGLYHSQYYDEDDGSDGIPDWATNQRKYYDTLRYNNKRQRVQLTVNQHISDASLYVVLSHQNYWGTSAYDSTIQMGGNTTWRRISYGLFYQNSRSNHDYKDNSINFNLSIPFSIFDANRDMTASFSSTHSKQSGDGFSTGLSGTLLDDNRMNYYLQTGHTENGGNTSVANLGYQGSYGNIELAHSYNTSYQQTSLNVSGGIVAHSGGITLSQPLQNTFVLVEAKGAQGVRLENQPGVAIDHFGYAVQTSSMPYRHNRVALRTSDIGSGLDIPLAAKDIVPTNRAIGKVVFETHLGQSLLIHSKLDTGDEPMIGASIFNDQGDSIGVVGTQGKAYVSGVESGETLKMKWGDNADDACIMIVPELPSIDTDKPGGYQEVTLTCSTK